MIAEVLEPGQVHEHSRSFVITTPEVTTPIWDKMKYKVIFAVLVGLLAVYVGYFASLPVPDGLPEPWKMRALTMFRYTVSSNDMIFAFSIK